MTDPSPLAKARAAALAELRAAPPAVSWRRLAARLVAAEVAFSLVAIAATLAGGLARPADVVGHLLTVAPLLAVCAAGAVAAIAPRLGRPGVAWRVAVLAAAPAVMALLVFARGPGVPSATPGWVCSVSHLGVGLAPLVFVLVALRQSAPSWTRAGAAGLGAGTTGALLGELVCRRGAQHVLVYHLGAWVLLALACVALSRWLKPRTFAP